MLADEQLYSSTVPWLLARDHSCPVLGEWLHHRPAAVACPPGSEQLSPVQALQDTHAALNRMVGALASLTSGSEPQLGPRHTTAGDARVQLDVAAVRLAKLHGHMLMHGYITSSSQHIVQLVKLVLRGPLQQVGAQWWFRAGCACVQPAPVLPAHTIHSHNACNCWPDVLACSMSLTTQATARAGSCSWTNPARTGSSSWPPALQLAPHMQVGILATPQWHAVFICPHPAVYCLNLAMFKASMQGAFRCACSLTCRVLNVPCRPGAGGLQQAAGVATTGPEGRPSSQPPRAVLCATCPPSAAAPVHPHPPWCSCGTARALRQLEGRR